MTMNPKIFRMLATATLGFSGLSVAVAQPAFTPYRAIPTGSWPEATAIGDVNGDGLKDVVMTTSSYFDPENDYKLFVFLQAANGQLQTPTKYATQGTYTSRPQSVDIGDVNGDGKNDVVVGNDRANIQVFLQDPNGNLASSAIYATQNSTVIKIGDLNDDGRLDVAGIGHGTSNASVLYQNPDGTLTSPLSFTAPHGGFDDLDIGDINADNRNDLIVMSGQGYAYSNLAILTQSVSGSFDPVVFYDLGFDVNTQGLGVGDVNGDLLNDVIVSYGGNRPASNIGIFHQRTSGLLTSSATNLPSYDIPESIEVKDVTGDGLSDVVVLHGGWNRLGVYVQTADGSLGPEQLFPIPYASRYNVQGLALGDINNDGHTDAAIADYNNGLVVLYQENEGTNHPPVAQAGSDQSLELGPSPLQVVLDGSNSSDPDNDPISYHWTLSVPAASKAALNDPSLAIPSFTADVKGIYTAQLQVFDGNTHSETDTVTISVVSPNLPPIANAGSDQQLQLGQNPLQVLLDGRSSSDPEGSALSFNWTLSVPAQSKAVLNDRTLANPTFAADVAGTYSAQLKVYDGNTYSQTDTAIITVSAPANMPPTAVAGSDQRVRQSTLVNLDGLPSYDTDGTIKSWSWTQIGGPTVTLSNASSAKASFTAPKLKGQIDLLLTFELKVTDDDGATATDRIQITVVK